MGTDKNIKLHIVTDIKQVFIKMTSEGFNTAAEEVKNISQLPTNDELLKTYSLYKQATVGDCDTTRPGIFDRKGCAKWDAWNARKGGAKQQAEDEYIEHVEELKGKYGMKE